MFLEDYDEEFYRNAFKKEAHEEGYNEGHAKGRAEGRAEGETVGETRMVLLIRKLRAANRDEDLNRALDDNEFRETLFQEFRL